MMPSAYSLNAMRMQPEALEIHFNQLMKLTVDNTMFYKAIQILEEIKYKIIASECRLDPFWMTVVDNITKQIFYATGQELKPVTSISRVNKQKFEAKISTDVLKSYPTEYFECILYFDRYFNLNEDVILISCENILPLFTADELKNNLDLIYNLTLICKKSDQDFRRKIFLIILDVMKQMITVLIDYIFSCSEHASLLAYILTDYDVVRTLIKDLIIESKNTEKMKLIFLHIQSTRRFLDTRTNIPSIDREKTLFEVLRNEKEKSLTVFKKEEHSTSTYKEFVNLL